MYRLTLNLKGGNTMKRLIISITCIFFVFAGLNMA